MERGWKVLATTSIGSFMVFTDTSILNVAFRSIVADYGVSQQLKLTWVFSAYSIAFAAALLTAGRVGDRYGRKRAYLTGVVVFAASSLLCAVATGPNMLIAARIVQALGGALIVPAALALVLPEFPPEKRSVAIGLSGAVGGLSAAISPALGGVLVEAFGWRSVFTINLPISVVALLLGRSILNESRDEGAVKLPDPLGGVLAIGGFGLLTAAIVQGDSWGWRSGRVVGAVVAAVVLLAAFVVRSSRHPIPVVDLALFKLRFFTAANLSAFLFSMGFFAMFFTNVTFLQAVWHYSPVRSGLASSPGPIVAGIFAGPAGGWAARKGHKVIIVPGLVLFAAGIGYQLLMLGAEPDYLIEMFPASLLAGLGVGLTISTLGSASSAFLPPNRFGMGSAVNATGRQIGAAMGIATVSALRAAAGGTDPMTGFRRSWTFIIVTAVLAGVALVALFRRPTDAEVEASRVVVAAAH